MNRVQVRQKNRRERFAAIRYERFKTNAALAEALGEGFSPSFISQLLSGHRGIGDDVADKIETILGLTPGWLDLSIDSPVAAFEWVYSRANQTGRDFLMGAVKAVSEAYLVEDRRQQSIPVLTDRRQR